MILENFASGPDRFININEQGFEKPGVGDTVAVDAVDWASYNAQRYTATEAFDIVRGRVYGQVVRVTDEMIAVAMQVFEDGGVRNVVALPWVTVTRVVLFERANEEGKPFAFVSHVPSISVEDAARIVADAARRQR